MDHRVTLESRGGTARPITVDRATNIELTRDIMAPAEARFEIGDDGTWSAIRDAIATGSRWTVAVDGRPWLTGRLLAKQLPISSQAGATVQVTIRTALADAQFASCNPKISVKQTTIEQLVYDAYAETDVSKFVFGGNFKIDPLSGKSRSNEAEAIKVRTLKAEEARVHPPETVFAFVARHLQRFGLQHWDGPDGSIYIGAPDDTQPAAYKLRCLRRRGAQNNVLGAAKQENFEEVPDALWAFGVGGGKDVSKAKVRAVEFDATLAAVQPPLRRGFFVIDQALKTKELAQRRVANEMSTRSRAKDAWQVDVDGWAHWDGSRWMPYDVDTVADVHVDLAGIPSGAHLVIRVDLSGSAGNGFTAKLSTVAKGIWKL